MEEKFIILFKILNACIFSPNHSNIEVFQQIHLHMCKQHMHKVTHSKQIGRNQKFNQYKAV